MTLIIGMYYGSGKGALVLSDSRVMLGPDYAVSQKVFMILDRAVFAAAGIVGITNRLLPRIEEAIVRARAYKLEEIIDVIEDEMAACSHRYKNPRQPRFDPDEPLCQAITAGIADNGRPALYLIHDNGFAEPIADFRPIGDGQRHVNNILKNLYDPSISKQRALEIGVHAIMQAAKGDAVVDDNPQAAIIEEKDVKILNMNERKEFQIENEELAAIKERINGVEAQRTLVFDLLLNGSREIKEKFREVMEEYKKQKESGTGHEAAKEQDDQSKATPLA